MVSRTDADVGGDGIAPGGSPATFVA